jgi:hypothetical protein
MSYHGDYAPGDVVTFNFNTISGTGVPAALTSGSLSIGVLKDDGTTIGTTGVVSTYQIGSRQGLHNCRITTVSDSAFFSAGSDYCVIITVGQISGGGQVVNYVVGEFSISNRAPNVARAEPGQAAAPATASPLTKLDYLYKAFRNIKRQTATGWSLLGDDDATVHQKATVSDDGTTATKGKIVSGP